VLPVPVPLLLLVLFRGLEKPEGHENTVAPSASRPEAGSSPGLQWAARSPAHFRRAPGGSVLTDSKRCLNTTLAAAHGQQPLSLAALAAAKVSAGKPASLSAT
jgi:hypothetical protein